MIKEQVEVEILAVHLDKDLPADKGEAGSELQKETLDMIHQGLLDLALTPGIGRPEEVEDVRVLEDLAGHVRRGGRERRREVGHGPAPAFVDAAFDLHPQDGL